ncbi:hypothetical protein EBZ37_11155 [bacterium]|nr:hypothetical protein [bacterium]
MTTSAVQPATRLVGVARCQTNCACTRRAPGALAARSRRRALAYKAALTTTDEEAVHAKETEAERQQQKKK